MDKRVFAVLFCLSLLFYDISPMAALAPDPETGASNLTEMADELGSPSSEEGEGAPTLLSDAEMFITILGDDEPEPKTPVQSARLMTPRLLFLPTGGDVRSLTLPTDIVVLYSRFGALQNLSAVWDFDGFDLDQTGRQELVGAVILPDGYAYYDENGVEAPLLIRQPVWVHSPEMEETEEVIFGQFPLRYGMDLLLPLGIDAAEAQEKLDEHCMQQALLTTADGFMLYADCHWKPEDIDLNEAGVYQPFQLDLPPGITLAEIELSLTGTRIIVMDPNRVDLSGVTRDADMWFDFYATWICEVQTPVVHVAMRSSPDEQELTWHELDAVNGRNEDVPGVYTMVGSTHLSIIFELGYAQDMEYIFQVHYDGGESNYVSIRPSEEGLPPAVGDRIGDLGGNKEPPSGEKPEIPNPEQPGPVEPYPSDPPTEEESESKPPETPVESPPSAERPTFSFPWLSKFGDFFPVLPILPINTEPTPPSQPDVPASDTVTDIVFVPAEDNAADIPATNTAIPSTPLPAVTIQSVSRPETQVASDTSPTIAEPDPAVLPGVAMTGASLGALLKAKQEQLSFRQDDVQVWIAHEALSAIELGDADVFTVCIDYLPGESLAVFLTINNQIIEAFSAPITVGIPWNEGDAPPCGTDNPLSCTYSATDGLLRIVMTPGTIFFPAQQPEEEKVPELPVQALLPPIASAQEGEAPAGGGFPMIYGMIGVLGAGGVGVGTLAYRGRRKRR